VRRKIEPKLVNEKESITVVCCLVSKGKYTLRGRALRLDPRCMHNDCMDAVLDKHESIHIFILSRLYFSLRESSTNMRIEPAMKLVGFQIHNRKTLEVQVVDAPWNESRNHNRKWIHIHSSLCEGLTKRNNDLDT
jgi:hypothetical protein